MDVCKLIFIVMNFHLVISEPNYSYNFHQTCKIINLIKTFNARSVLFIHDIEYMSSAFLEWPYTIKLISLHLSIDTNTSIILPDSRFDLLLIWVRYPINWMDLLDSEAFQSPFLIKRKLILLLVDDYPELDYSSGIQDVLIWRQNQIFFLTYDKTHSCKNFNLLNVQYEKELNYLKISYLHFTCATTNCVLNILSTQNFPSHKYNISVGIFPYEPDAIAIEKFDNGTWLFAGFVYDLLAYYLCPMMKISMIEVYGDSLPSTGDNEVIFDMIINNALDTSTTPYIMSSDRVSYLDSLALDTKYDNFAVAIAQESKVKEFMWLTFANPLSYKAWILSTVFFIVITLITLAINKAEKKTDNINFKPTVKILDFLFYFFYYFILSAHSAVLYSSFTIQPTKNLFETLDDLVTDGGFVFYAHEDFEIHDISKMAKAGNLKLLYNLMKKSPNGGKVSDFEKVYASLFTQRNAFAHYFNLFQHDLETDCRYHLIKLPDQIGLPLVFGKRSKFVEVFSEKLILLKEFGLLTKLDKDYTSERICKSEASLAEPCTLYHTISAFVILLIGIAVSLIFFLMELIKTRTEAREIN